jgi:hypothetical protein
MLTPAFDTSASDTFTLVYNNGSTWTRTTGQTQINNTQYNVSGTLTTMANNKFRVDYIYVLINNPSKLYVVLGNTEYSNILDARLSVIPTVLPVELQRLGVLVGRSIIEKSNTTINEIASNFDVRFASGAVTNHNDLAGLNVADYQHLTIAEKAIALAGGGVTPKIRTLTSADLTIQNIAGFKIYADALSPNLVIASNEIYDFHVTDTGQVFSYKKNGVTIGLGQTGILVGDVLELELPRPYHKVTHVKQMSGGLFNAAFIANPVFTEDFITADSYTYSSIVTNSFVFDFKIIFNKKMTVSKFLKFTDTLFVNDEIKTCNIHAITNIAYTLNGAHDAVLANFPLIFDNHTGSDAVFPTPTTSDMFYYQNQKSLITYPIAIPTDCYGIRIIGKSNFGATSRYAITKFLFS